MNRFMKRIVLTCAMAVTLCAIALGQGQPAEPTPAKEPAPVNAPPIKRNKPANLGFGAVAGGTGVYSYSSGSVGSRSSGVPPVVVRFSGSDDEANAAMEEDLTVMTHLIERSLEHGIGEDAPDEKLGIRMLYSEGGRSVRAVYLEGFGPLFMIKVGFPVFASGNAEAKEPAPASDTEWDKAKRDLYGANEERVANAVGIGGGSRFDPEQVDALKKVLLQSLKNAANIRNLKPADFVAFTVFGQPVTVVQVKKSRTRSASNSTPPSAETSASRKSSTDAGRADQKAQATGLARASDLLRSSTQGTVLSLRAKKSDVDDFASGKLDFESFAKKTEQHSYPGNGYGITSINSWSRSGTAGSMLLRQNFSSEP